MGKAKKEKEKEKLVINHYTLQLPSSTQPQQHSLIPKTYRTLLNILTITPLQPFITISPLTALTSPAYADPDSDYYSGAHILQLIAYVIAHITVSCTIYSLTSPERQAVPPRIQLLIWGYYQFALLIIDASLLYSARISWSLQGSPVNPVREWRGVDWILVAFTLMAALTRVAFLFKVGFPKQVSPEERRKAWDEDNKKFWDGVNDGTSSIVCNG
ncbi:hypothetical protein HER10_EVM0002966 [Colletotrichum scovillei]|uniref:Beta-mannosidase MndA n=1 Tax=Colletotrichum scovillei TaxID=1209932 RepID=A0A9P7QXB2_9PEZI|nr:uncharacterized protein HER10_EVM0002966 [Colletotrichum scovillei]KAF4784009.1 hypothetical protein HER10_EVM0002966 [Colletotrichum scovillei]KAG7044354.1 beta-mannosidase MndA [Colletotrichum scovillei]KAG7049063.1 beta-mannosidase MndA [Colletotrichum scovillei]KAG7063807.1 beta-mannosidase MndA [Colletotrichum scovillei]